MALKAPLQDTGLPEIFWSKRKRRDSGRVLRVSFKHKDCDEWDLWINLQMSFDFISQWAETSLQNIRSISVSTSLLYFLLSVVWRCTYLCNLVRQVLWPWIMAAHGKSELHEICQLANTLPALPACVDKGLTLLFCFGVSFWMPEQNMLNLGSVVVLSFFTDGE